MNETIHMNRSLAGKEGIRISTGEVYSFPPHYHDYYEMLLYEPFRGVLSVNDHAPETSEALVILMTPSDLHAIAPQSTSPFIKIAFTEVALGDYLLASLKGAICSPVDPLLRNLFDAVLMAATYEECEILLRAIVLCLLYHGTPLPSPHRTSADETIRQATAILLNEFATEITLLDLASRLNVSYRHLSVSFQTKLGISFSDYLQSIRLHHAKALLKNTDLPITEVCFRAGYRNLSHFLRVFKKNVGATPKEYRKMR